MKPILLKKMLSNTPITHAHVSEWLSNVNMDKQLEHDTNNATFQHIYLDQIPQFSYENILLFGQSKEYYYQTSFLVWSK